MTTPRLIYSPELIRKAAQKPAPEQNKTVPKRPPTKRKKPRYPALKVVKHILPTDSKIVRVRKMTISNIKLFK